MTAYGGFQVCHSSVPGVLALSVHHPQKVSSMLLVAENISLLFQQLTQVIMLSYDQAWLILRWWCLWTYCLLNMGRLCNMRRRVQYFSNGGCSTNNGLLNCILSRFLWSHFLFIARCCTGNHWDLRRTILAGMYAILNHPCPQLILWFSVIMILTVHFPKFVYKFINFCLSSRLVREL